MNADDELQRRVLEVLEGAADLEPSERRDYVLSRTADQPELRDEVLGLLSLDDEARDVIATGGAIPAEPPLPATREIGAYRIEREIGRGGMGSVYLAHRTNDDFDHTVAIKVVRQSLASDRYVTRLRAERQTLARLKHPNIAQLHDGGELPDGAPYVVMEYVDGVRLDHFLADEHVGLSERLRLFRQICRAVSYAHRNLVIHRDLSPANVLVDDDRQVKLIDFGIAQSLDEDETSQTDGDAPRFTMTKAYAAPERRRGAMSSTATDIYSLGKILADLIADLAMPRRRDLEAVIAKACDAESERRYPTADALLDDIDAYRSRRAVGAVNGSWSYHLTRFIGRRKLAVAVGATFIVVMGATSILMSILYLRADAAESQASQRFDELRELAGFMIFELHDELEPLEGSATAREKLTRTALAYLDTLSASRDVSDELRLEIGLGYKRLSDVTGSPASANLGQRDLASQLLGKAATQIEALGSLAGNAAALRAYAEILLAAGRQEAASDRGWQSAQDTFLRARHAASELAALDEATLSDRILEGRIDVAIGYYREEPADAIREIGLGLSKYEALARQYPDDVELLSRIARTNSVLAEKLSWQIYYDQQGEYTDVLPYFNNGVSILRRLMADSGAAPEIRNHLIVVLMERSNTTCYMASPYLDQGLADLEEALRLAEDWTAANPRDRRSREYTTHVMQNQSMCFANAARFEDAVRVGQTVIARREAALAENPGNAGLFHDLVGAMLALSAVHRAAGDEANACLVSSQFNDALSAYASTRGSVDPFVEEQSATIADFIAECETKGLL